MNIKHICTRTRSWYTAKKVATLKSIWRWWQLVVRSNRHVAVVYHRMRRTSAESEDLFCNKNNSRHGLLDSRTAINCQLGHFSFRAWRSGCIVDFVKQAQDDGTAGKKDFVIHQIFERADIRYRIGSEHVSKINCCACVFHTIIYEGKLHLFSQKRTKRHKFNRCSLLQILVWYCSPEHLALFLSRARFCSSRNISAKQNAQHLNYMAHKSSWTLFSKILQR